MNRFLTLLLLPLLLLPERTGAQDNMHPQVIINEILASNNEGLRDEDGDNEDWIELWNTGDEPVPLQWYGLTDRAGDHHRWVFPDTTIYPGEFMLIWASGKDRRSPGSPLHANFSLDRQGEPLRLSDIDGNRLDTVPPVAIPTDYSYGRVPGETDEWAFFSKPTPGAPNETESVGRMLDPPVFSHEGGFHADAFELRLSLPDNAEGAEIRYTTDGSEPGPNSGKLYTGPILIVDRTEYPNDISMIPTNNYDANHPYNENWKEPEGQVFKGTVVRAVTIAPDSEPVGVASRSFFVGSNLEDRYRFPVISLATDREHLFSHDRGIYAHGNFWNRTEEWERPVHVEFYEPGGKSVLAQDAGVRIHGGTSRGRPLKSLRIYARRSYGKAWFEHPLIPDAPVDTYKRFLLRNSGNDWDGTFFRDALMQELIAHTGVETQYYRPAVVFINGEYWGIQNIRKRFDHRYFESMYQINRDDLVLFEGNAEIKEGTTADRRAYLDLRTLLEEGAVNDANVWQEVENRMDIVNFRDYHIANIYYRNTDWPGNNIDFWRKRTNGPRDDAPMGHDGRWRWLLYDTDFGFNLDFDYVIGRNERANHNTLAFAVQGTGGWPNPQWSVAMLRGALRNDNFQNEFINRFADLLNTAFAPERVIREIDRMHEALKPHIEEHIRRWRGPASLIQWENEVDAMRSFAENRPAAQREHILGFFNLRGMLELELDVNDSKGGYLSVNTIRLKRGEVGVSEDPWPWSGTYFQGIPVTVTAHPADGYEFSGWEGHSEPGRQLDLLSFEENESLKAVFRRKNASTGSEGEYDDGPHIFKAAAPRPNPFNHSTVLQIELPEEKTVRISAYSVDGRRIGELHNRRLQRGVHSLRIDAGGWASGVYIIVAEAGYHRKSFPVTLIK
ncbi:CotH kinase family protein [Balneolales bacterium ANBcel1]|nr:CotH kinase family protein [Balneolales bacterium ANBcel1]